MAGPDGGMSDLGIVFRSSILASWRQTHPDFFTLVTRLVTAVAKDTPVGETSGKSREFACGKSVVCWLSKCGPIDTIFLFTTRQIRQVTQGHCRG
ncbi:hypothetical protein V7x_13090 [Crateriforma conspicua]|uniref:Uncharacterized protein n=1 Tax=Crateriforma conspicua TaxID=2527996 RepID=A0A5C6FWF7_9PLAN|nr:hypothetical protein V7x_13090 [Crateriforma conspicua]